MAQRFKAKTLLSNSGVFNNEVVAPNLVYNTGNQTIAGVKTFSAGIALSTISADLSNNASIDFSDDDSITISGGSQVYMASPLIQTSSANLGAKVLFGDYNQVTPFEFVNIHGGNLLVDHTGIFLSGIDLKNSKLNNASNVIYNTGDQTISGVKTFSDGFILNGGITGVNLVYNTGNQTISGVKAFASRPTISGTGVLLSGELAAEFKFTGDLDVSLIGTKTFGRYSNG